MKKDLLIILKIVWLTAMHSVVFAQDTLTKPKVEIDSIYRLVHDVGGDYFSSELPIIEEAIYPGGIKTLSKFLRDSIRIENLTEKQTLSLSKIYVEISIDSSGKVEEVKILRGSEYYLNERITSAFEKMPNWIPAKNINGNARSTIRIPMSICLNE